MQMVGGGEYFRGGESRQSSKAGADQEIIFEAFYEIQQEFS